MSNAWIDAQQRREEWFLRYKVGRDISRDDPVFGDGRFRLVVTAGIRRLSDGPFYWSITAEVFDKTKKRDDGVVACGPQKRRVLDGFPELRKITVLHNHDYDREDPAHREAEELLREMIGEQEAERDA